MWAETYTRQGTGAPASNYLLFDTKNVNKTRAWAEQNGLDSLFKIHLKYIFVFLGRVYQK
jgi:hypothetical protein